jgi:hypothetical protein
MRHTGSITGFFLAAALVTLAAFQSRNLAAARKAGLPEAYAGYSADTPPALTFVMAGLGGFRGIVAEVLWFRAERLQEEARFMELVQLSEWLTKLDPHAAEAWVYNAWNLSYNISVMMIRPEDRLRWVKNGISLLRDDGLRFNPREARIYRELAWMFMNKFGITSLDEARDTYREDLANAFSPCVNTNGTVRLTADARKQITKFKMDADRMAALEKRFGPLDWRLAEPHAVYWATAGVDCASGTERLFCRRIVYQSLFLLILEDESHAPVERLALATATTDFFEETLKEYPSRTLTSVYLHYLARLAAFAHDNGNDALARDCLKRFIAALPPDIKDRPTLADIIADGHKFSHAKRN